MDLKGLYQLVEERRFADLEHRLEEVETGLDEEEPLEVLRFRSELAAEGRGTVVDAVVAARELVRAGHDEAPSAVARAVRLLGGCGATSMAQDLLDQGLERWSEDERLALARHQLEVGRFEGTSWDQWKVMELLLESDVTGARLALEGMLTGADLLWAMRLLVDLQRGTLDFGDAASTFLRAVKVFPKADEVLSVRLAAALARLAEGVRDQAVDELKKLREETSNGVALALYVNRTCASVLEAIDSSDHPEAQGRWFPRSPGRVPNKKADPGRGVVWFVGEQLGETIDVASPLPSLPFVRHALSGAGISTIRVLLDEQTVVTALEASTMIVIEEERPTETGFLLIEGYDLESRLFLVRDPYRPGPFFRTIDEQWDRCSLFGRSALVVGGVGAEAQRRFDELAAQGVVHDERLDALDRCDVDEDGRVPQQARIAALAEEARDHAPELPLPRKRLGEAILEQMRLGVISPHRTGPYDRWFAETRYRFPEAEWPHQIHAQALELQNRIEEAGVAWSDAAARDPYDHRNFTGRARARAMLGDHSGAERDLRRALTLEPRNGEALCQSAEIALARGDITSATLVADLAIELAPEDPEALLVAATTRERRDSLDEAIALLERAAALSDRPAFATLRLIRRRVHEGDWERAKRSSERYCSLASGSPGAWSTSAWVSWCQSDIEGALGAATTGLQRCGPDRDLIEMAVASAGLLLPPEQVGDAIAPVVETLHAAPQAVLDLSSELARLRLWELAAEVGFLAHRLLPEGPNATWRTVQNLLAEDAARAARHEDIITLLRGTIERAQKYPQPRVLLGWLISEDAPEEALELVESVDDHVAPAMVWNLMEHLFSLLGRDEAVEKVRARMPELYPAGVIEPASFLRACGFVDQARHLLSGAIEAFPDHPGLNVELALTLHRAGEAERALELLTGLEEREPGRVTPSLMLLVATTAQDWELVERCAADAMEKGRRESGRGFVDPWPDRARHAGARLALGDEAPRLRLLELAGNHPDALTFLHTIERLVDHPLGAETLRHIEEVAPGIPQILDRGGLR